MSRYIEPARAFDPGRVPWVAHWHLTGDLIERTSTSRSNSKFDRANN